MVDPSCEEAWASKIDGHVIDTNVASKPDATRNAHDFFEILFRDAMKLRRVIS
jgi:hypothetical protein